MKHLIVTLMVAVLSICTAMAERVWVQVTSVEELAEANQFKIYPCAKVEDGTLMCSNAATAYGDKIARRVVCRCDVDAGKGG